MKLHEIAYSREGDKCDVANICCFPYDENDWELVRREVTVERVRAKMGDLVRGDIVRYEYPNLKGLNFVMYQALDGGGTMSLRVDRLGKTLASLFLDIDIGARPGS
jgi:hypothetical protein